MNFQPDPGGSFKMQGVWCEGPGCGFSVPNLEVAAAADWQSVANKIYCPLHWYGARREDRKARMRAEVERIQAEALDKIAKTGLTGREYAEWDKFQSDLADYHKKNQKPAPKPLRLMNPYQFLYQVKKNGPIVLEDEIKRLEEAKARTTERLKGI